LDCLYWPRIVADNLVLFANSYLVVWFIGRRMWRYSMSTRTKHRCSRVYHLLCHENGWYRMRRQKGTRAPIQPIWVSSACI